MNVLIKIRYNPSCQAFYFKSSPNININITFETNYFFTKHTYQFT